MMTTAMIAMTAMKASKLHNYEDNMDRIECNPFEKLVHAVVRIAVVQWNCQC
jgi:hypothetical protein